MNETSFKFGERSELYGTYHAPVAGSTLPRLAVVFCAPFAEEMKCSVRTYVLAARTFADAGVPSLRFDYFGTGDSDGSFSEFSPHRAVSDIVRASAVVRELSRAPRLVLLGLRLGAALALMAARDADAESVILWQPVVNGKTFFDLNIQRAMLRKQLIGSSPASGGAPYPPDRSEVSDRPHDRIPADLIDLDGYPLSRSAAAELRALDGLALVQNYRGRIHLLQIAHTNDFSREYQQLADACGARRNWAAVICPPFWNRIDLTDTSPVIRATLPFLA